MLVGSKALTRALSDFMTGTGRATSLLKYARIVEEPGIREALEADAATTVRMLNAQGVLKRDVPGALSDRALARAIAGATSQSARSAIRLAASVVFHTAFEEYLLRLVRLAAVFNRSAALALIAERKISLKEIGSKLPADLEDDCLEAWLAEIEQKSAPMNWDALVKLADYPNQLSEGEWHFDRRLLVEFDGARHDAVHGSGRLLDEMDIEHAFAQMHRVPLVWSVHLHRQFGLYLLQDTFFTPRTEDPTSGMG